MKKALSIVLVLAMLLSFAGCSLFSDKSVVYIDKDHSVNDPEGLSYDDRIVLNNTGFAEEIETMVNAAAYPDTMVYDESGNMIGMYAYDETTGLANGWTRLDDGSFVALPEGEEKDLGKPDTSKMIDIPGEVVLGCVVYGSKTQATDAYLYFFLSDASAKETVKTNVTTAFGLELTEENDTLLVCHQDADYIAQQFQMLGEEAPADKSVAAYTDVLKSYYMLREYTGESAYKPFADIVDPTDIEFDQKVVLAGSGEYAVPEENAGDLSAMTDVVYGKEGKTVAHCTYYEAPDKAAGDRLETVFKDNDYSDVTRVSDTAVLVRMTGKELESTISMYIGYSIVKDDSVAEYVRNIEETYLSVVCE